MIENQKEVPNNNLRLDSLITGISDDKIVQMVESNQHSAETYLQSSGYYDEWQEWYDLYRSIPEKKPYDWMSNKFIPNTFSDVEVATALIMAFLFSVNPPVEIKPFETGDKEQARLIRKLLSYQFEPNMEYKGFFWEFYQLVKMTNIYGTGISKIYHETKWNRHLVKEEIKSPLLNILGLNIGERTTGYKDVSKQFQVFNGPVMKVCNIDDIFPDPQSIEVQDSWIIHRTRRNLAYLRQMHKNYPEIYNDNVNLINEAESDEEKTSYSQGTMSHMNRLSRPAVERPNPLKLKKVVEWWGEYDLKNDGEPIPCVFTVCDHRLIRRQSNPFEHQLNPFIKTNYVPVLNDFWGIGLPEIGADLQHLKNETINQRVDNLTLYLNAMFKYRKGAGIDKSKLIMAPGKLFGFTDSPDDIQIERPEFVARDTFTQVAEIDRQRQETTGITKLTTGMGGSDINQTATGMGLLSQATSQRFSITAKLFEICGLKETAKMFYSIIYQFSEEKEIQRILGKELPKDGFIMLTPIEIAKNYDFIPSGISTMENKQAKALRLIQFLNISKDNPLIKMDEVIKKIYSLLEIGDDPYELLRNDEEMVQYLQTITNMTPNRGAETKTDNTGGGAGGSSQSSQKIPGMGKSGSITTGVNTGTPGVPPTNMAVPPGERV